MKDLLVITADKTMKRSFYIILSKINKEFLNIQEINIEENDILSHPENDPGVRKGGVELSRSYTNEYKHCLLVFDWEGCGREKKSSIEKEVKKIKSGLYRTGWGDRAEVIIIDPELEIWIWNNSLHVAKALGWKRWRDLREWLIGKKYLREDEVKPKMPKEVLREALKIGIKGKTQRKAFSSAIHMEIARKVSYRKCEDRNFGKLISTLQEWFPTQKKSS
ncbi:MAG: hypothetical protein K8T10_00155 [Candidatus Eremiobacteraeota bacterium]|nr:hypothetical protein [Candidatus Eremiobacteraeota bacterium]